MKRLATSLVLIPVITWLVLAGPEWAFIAVVAAIGLLAFHEYARMASAHGTLRAGWPGMAAGLVLLLAPAPGIVVVLAAIAGMALALRSRDLTNTMASAAVFTLGVVYIFGSWRCALELRAMNHHWLMFALLASWAGDTAAFYVGRALGRHKMAPRVSPAKSWEGAIGSAAGGVVSCGVYAHYLLPAIPLGVALSLAAAGNVAGQVGDLCESALKRGAGVKDSGSLLPGHGGWLDRIDASLFCVPVIYALVKAFPVLIRRAP
jgi:phosphatidate cytidylyltransferase